MLSELTLTILGLPVVPDVFTKKQTSVCTISLLATTSFFHKYKCKLPSSNKDAEYNEFLINMLWFLFFVVIIHFICALSTMSLKISSDVKVSRNIKGRPHFNKLKDKDLLN